MSISFYISYSALWTLVILQSLILLGLVRMVYQFQQSGAVAGSGGGGMTSGQEAPQFSTVDLSGALISSKSFAGHLTAVLFVSPKCPSCTTSLDEMKALNYKANGNVIVICRGGREDCALLAETNELNMPVVADEDDRISRLYRISSAPTAVLIDANNRIQSYGYPLREELEEMFEKAPEAEVQEVDQHGHGKHGRSQAPGFKTG